MFFVREKKYKRTLKLNNVESINFNLSLCDLSDTVCRHHWPFQWLLESTVVNLFSRREAITEFWTPRWHIYVRINDQQCITYSLNDFQWDMVHSSMEKFFTSLGPRFPKIIKFCTFQTTFTTHSFYLLKVDLPYFTGNLFAQESRDLASARLYQSRGETRRTLPRCTGTMKIQLWGMSS